MCERILWVYLDWLAGWLADWLFSVCMYTIQLRVWVDLISYNFLLLLVSYHMRFRYLCLLLVCMYGEQWTCNGIYLQYPCKRSAQNCTLFKISVRLRTYWAPSHTNTVQIYRVTLGMGTLPLYLILHTYIRNYVYFSENGV